MVGTVATRPTPKGNANREAIDSLRGYVYQVYQSALAWIELEADEFLFLEVAEDYAVVARQALEGVQVKDTARNVTINSPSILTSIDSYVDLVKTNPRLQVKLRHLTTAVIGKEKSAEHRIGDTPTLETWRKLAKTGDVEPLRKILHSSKLSQQTKDYIRRLDDTEFRETFLQRIHFDCGALDSKYLVCLLRSRLRKLVMERGGGNSQVDGCFSNIVTTLLQKAIQNEDRFVDTSMLEELLERATQITINRTQFEAQMQLINKALAAFDAQETNLVATRLSEPRPIDEVPLPAAIASRTIQIDSIVSSLTEYGVGWIFGAAGVGKTVAAKLSARRLGGNWIGINLRGLNSEEVALILSCAIDRLIEQKTTGFLVDDLECSLEPHLIDIILYLRFICNRTDLFLLFTSPRPPSSDFLFSANLPAAIGQKLEDFSQNDIQEILFGLGVHYPTWAKYIYVVSGGGHPQLAVAAIQSMQNNDWDTNEFKTLDSLLVSNPAIEQVRTRTRERLLHELPEGGRRLLERLSLKPGSFRRSFVLNMAQIAPRVPDGGILFDGLIGTWVDQQGIDRFALSPLLLSYAVTTLTYEEQRTLYFEVANSLVDMPSIDPTEANSALLAALSGKNIQVILRLCMTVLRTDQQDLEMIAPHLMMFTLIKTDTFAYKDDPVVSQILRGAQLLLLCQDVRSRDQIQEVFDRFESESDRVEDRAMRTSMSLLIYAKLLLSEPKFGALPNFWDLVRKLDVLLEDNDKQLSPVLMGNKFEQDTHDIPIVGLTFGNQARQVKLIRELLPMFDFLDSCGIDLRQKVLNFYSTPDFHIDLLVSGAWLSEHEAQTINPRSHSDVFARLEEFAKSWGHTDLAVCCRKYRAIIIDEYGDDKEHALLIIEEGLTLYGDTNSELVRAKAQVLYRAEDHQGNLVLSKALIDGDALRNEIDKAFLGRDAAISAEKQGDFETARRYYLYGSNAARNCSFPDMEPMRVGLMADAALVSWHAGDREECLRDLVAVLHELNDIDPESSLRAAHIHAICRHVLLWLEKDATGRRMLLVDGTEPIIYPGIVSDPEPNPKIAERLLPPIEMAWYMLAVVEHSCCLDAGITHNLTTLLPKGPVVEGQILLSHARMRKAIIMREALLFVAALKDTVAVCAYTMKSGDYKKSLDIQNVTYGLLPTPTLELGTEISELAEQLILCFVCNCIFTESFADLDQLLDIFEQGEGFEIRKDFLSSLIGHGVISDYNTSLATLSFSHRSDMDKKTAVSPEHVFELALKALQVAEATGNTEAIAKYAFEWLNAKWTFIYEHQRFLLKYPRLYQKPIDNCDSGVDESWQAKLIHLLQAILPTMGFRNESQLSHALNDIIKAQC